MGERLLAYLVISSTASVVRAEGLSALAWVVVTLLDSAALNLALLNSILEISKI